MPEQPYDDIFRSRQTRRRGLLTRPFLALVLLIFTFIFVGIYRTSKINSSDTPQLTTSKFIQPTPTQRPILKIRRSIADQTRAKTELIEKIRKILDKTVGTYSVYIYDLDTDEGFGINEFTVFDAASITKLVILTSLYSLSEENKVDLNANITIQETDIQDYGSGQLRYDGAGKTYSIKSLARLMMEKSDNTAAYILGTQTVGQKRLVNYVKEWGLEQTNIPKNLSSSYDMSILLRKVYRGNIVSQASIKEMLGFMQQTDSEDRLPAKLPPGTTIYHKAGDQVSVSHDVGIIVAPVATYYIGVMTSNMLVAEPAVKASIAEVSKLVYEFKSGIKTAE